MSDSDSSRDSGDEEAELANLNVVFAASEQLRSVAVQMEQMAKMATLMSSCASKIVSILLAASGLWVVCRCRCGLCVGVGVSVGSGV